MRHIYILLFILGSVTTTLAQTSKPAPVVTRYYNFTGAIDKYPVTFHLYRVNDKFSGCYYYNSSEEAIDISGNINKDRFLELAHSDGEGNATEVLSGNFKDSTFSGTWSYKGKLLAFRVSTKNNNSGLAFDYIYTQGEKKLPKAEYGRAELNYEAAAVWPVAGSQHPAANLIKQLIAAEFDEKSSGEEIGMVMIKQKNEILNPVRKEDEAITYDLEKEVQVTYLSEKLLTLSASTYIDGGGAHPNHYTFYHCVDLIHNRKLTITDILDTVTCRAMLQALLEKKFRTVNHLGKEEKISDYLFSNIIPVGQNIMLTSKGIGFHYNPYEVGSYAQGDVYLYISYKELDSCLKPEFKQLMEMN
ncbi:hypothetical protein A4D02_31275 [Niastella koreensis]|uniref:DUF3298 domain-containing protein n=2 Tax=Niastella koreensis TaxID=354356 RepID=G8T7J8_NIAKG|nr:DUF3298 and DUF4163 domain-containing protein [Niastella koreensis]AEW02253.1 hypothetical protein Niako_6027 [Niastella koreensis GR20-10]OQP46518.1 hypothetical protein A4D02_31275 [Niastella koreensis]